MRTFALVFAPLLLAMAAPAADPALMQMLPPGAKVAGGIDVARVSASSFGQFVLARTQREDAGFREFIAATDFDPRRDINDLLFASTGEQKGKGVVLVRGKFNVAKLLEHAKAKGAVVTRYGAADVITRNAEEAGWVALLDESTALAGSPEHVRAALDGRGGMSQLEPRMSAKINDASAKYDAWMVSTLPPEHFARHAPDRNVGGAMRGNMMQAIEQVSGGIIFGDTVQIEGEALARSEKDATALVDVIKFLTGMVQLNRDRQPEVDRFAALLERMQVRAQGNTVFMNISIPESELERWFTERPQRRSRARRP